MIHNLHHPSCPAADDVHGRCICPPLLNCGDCGGDSGFHALACTFWDDHCRRCASLIVHTDPAAHVCAPPGARLSDRLRESWGFRS
jgi:hypothetical protein